MMSTIIFGNKISNGTKSQLEEIQKIMEIWRSYQNAEINDSVTSTYVGVGARGQSTPRFQHVGEGET